MCDDGSPTAALAFWTVSYSREGLINGYRSARLEENSLLRRFPLVRRFSKDGRNENISLNTIIFIILFIKIV